MIRTRTPLMLLPFLCFAFAAAGCFEDDPVKVKDDDPIAWPDMTERDDVITTILLCYENPGKSASMARYEALLHSLYLFYLDVRDVYPGEDPFLTRGEDILATGRMFADHTILDLAIVPQTGGSWEELAELDGQPCEGCWAGRREYMIRFQRKDEDIILQSNPGSAAVTIVVAPDESDPAKWVIRAIYDEYN